MSKPCGYARVLARGRIKGEVKKRLFGGPYIEYGYLCMVQAYFVQLGGILAVRHSAHLDAFGNAFVALMGPPDAMRRFFSEVAEPIVDRVLGEAMTFLEFVNVDYAKRIGDPPSLLAKVDASDVADLIWGSAIQGAALGSLYPNVIRDMFERTHARVPKADWERARAAGLDAVVVKSNETVPSWN